MDLDTLHIKNNWKVSNLRKIQCWIKWAVEICSIKFIVSLKSLQCDYFLCLQWWKRIFRPLDFYFFRLRVKIFYLLSFIIFSFSYCTIFSAVCSHYLLALLASFFASNFSDPSKLPLTLFLIFVLNLRFANLVYYFKALIFILIA